MIGKKNRLVPIIIGAHLFVVGWMALWLPKKTDKTTCPMVVQTVVLQPKPISPPPAPVRTAPPVKKTAAKPKAAPKKVVAKSKPKPKKTAPKKPQVSRALLQELQESIAKIDQKQDKELPKAKLKAPKAISKLKIDQLGIQIGGNYHERLVSRLQDALELPEVGEVKIALTLNKDGRFVKLEIERAESKQNQQSLERQLKKLSFPPFEGALKNKQEHTFVITFCNS